MHPSAMEPFGRALEAYQNGNDDAEVIVRRDDGVEGHLPVSHFFRESAAFTRIECEALDRCQGRVLDAGAGTGVHSLELQRRGMSVTAIDISPHAVHIMRKRGVKNAICSDIFALGNCAFDTILLMGHGIGMMETLSGLDRFLVRALMLLPGRGKILLDSMDPAVTNDSQNLTYHAANRLAGSYIGEVRMRFEFQGEPGPYCGWLHVDPATLAEHAAGAGWTCEIAVRTPNGEYLAQIEKQA